MSSAVHVVGVKGVVLRLEGGKEKGEVTGCLLWDRGQAGAQGPLCPAQSSSRPRGIIRHLGETSTSPHPGTSPRPSRASIVPSITPAPICTAATASRPRQPSHSRAPKTRLAGDHRTICGEGTMCLRSVTKLIAFNSLMDSVLCVCQFD